MSARFSPDRVYRYRLERHFPPFNKGIVTFILLNPSTADEEHDDPTIRRCIRYATDWGFTRLIVVNLFAFRATNPKAMRTARDPYGPENAVEITRAAQVADLVVAGWGAHGAYQNAGTNTIARLRHHGVDVYALALTKGGEPVHPLYQRADRRADVKL